MADAKTTDEEKAEAAASLAGALSFAKLGAALLGVAMLSLSTCTAAQSWSNAQVKIATVNASAPRAVQVVQSAPATSTATPITATAGAVTDEPYVPPTYDINYCAAAYSSNPDRLADCYHKLLVKVAAGQIRVAEGKGDDAKIDALPK